MNSAAQLSPFALLKQIETRSQERAIGLPQKAEVRRTWSGVGFRVGDMHLLVTMADIAEILKYPNITKVPSTLRWVKGLANIRGNLLPIMDLKGFVDNELCKIKKSSRVIVVQHGELSSGLLVDEVYGMRHFFTEEHSENLPDTSGKLKVYLKGSFLQNEVEWGVFSVAKLAQSSEFLNIAARV
ncbi:type IV pili signal transduction protein PilI [hydrothermal vent metagenome]|uniref:Type IV pili signal transduction protein PilI n=1 Tax=hydrothermal vent metagenome TaxID=652676 RepID=A0A3B1A8T0_9ZZZZ